MDARWSWLGPLSLGDVVRGPSAPQGVHGRGDDADMDTRISDPRGDNGSPVQPEVPHDLPGSLQAPGSGPPSVPTSELEQLMAQWVTEGVVSAEQAARMRADLARPSAVRFAQPMAAAAPQGTAVAQAGTALGPGPAVGPAGPAVPLGTAVATPAPPTPPGPARTSLVTEALGYLGGVIILVASILVAARFWDDLATAGRLAVVGAAATLLVAAGALVPARLGEAGQRLRAVLWLTGTAAFAGFMGILGDQALGWTESSLGLLVAGTTAAVAAVLWSLHHHPLQHAATLVGLLGAVAAAASFLPGRDTGVPGLAVWGAAVIWALLAWGGVLAWTGRPDTPNLGVVLGSVGAIFGAMATMPMNWGIVLALLTVGAVVAVAVMSRSLVLLAIGSIAALQTLPAAMVQWFGGTLGAALGLLVVGVMLVGAAIMTARRRQQQPLPGTLPGTRTWLPWPVRTTAVAGSAVVAASTTIAVLTLG